MPVRLPAFKVIKQKCERGEPLDDGDVTALASTKSGRALTLRLALNGAQFTDPQIEILKTLGEKDFCTLLHRLVDHGGHPYPSRSDSNWQPARHI